LEQLIDTAREQKVKTVLVIFALSALLTLPSYAQQFPQTERQKAEEDRDRVQAARKKANEQAIDEDYKSQIERTPSSNKKVDPWGNLRAPSK
jgi:hypothetical protein